MLCPLSGNQRCPLDCQHTEKGMMLCAQSDASGRLREANNVENCTRHEIGMKLCVPHGV